MKKSSKKIFDVIEVYIPTFIFLLLIITVTVQVFSRYVFDHPLPKFFELSIYSFVWVIYLGASLAKRYDRHIRFDILYRKLPRRTQLFIDIVFTIITNIVFLVVLIPSVKYTIWNYRIKASALRIPWTYLLLCFPIFVVLILIHNTASIYFDVKELSGKGIPHEEVPPWQ